MNRDDIERLVGEEMAERAAVPYAEVRAHVQDVNRSHHGTARDAFGGMSVLMPSMVWTREVFPLNRVPEVYPASKRDVKLYARYAKAGSPLPAVVLTIERGGRIAVQDGAHRIAAARSLGYIEIDAYVGRVA